MLTFSATSGDDIQLRLWHLDHFLDNQITQSLLGCIVFGRDFRCSCGVWKEHTMNIENVENIENVNCTHLCPHTECCWQAPEPQIHAPRASRDNQISGCPLIRAATSAHFSVSIICADGDFVSSAWHVCSMAYESSVASGCHPPKQQYRQCRTARRILVLAMQRSVAAAASLHCHCWPAPVPATVQSSPKYSMAKQTTGSINETLFLSTIKSIRWKKTLHTFNSKIEMTSLIDASIES